MKTRQPAEVFRASALNACRYALKCCGELNSVKTLAHSGLEASDKRLSPTRNTPRNVPDTGKAVDAYNRTASKALFQLRQYLDTRFNIPRTTLLTKERAISPVQNHEAAARPEH
ncbi:hypothetical protein ACEQ8H_008597 [Pleosporales sp. CAS-2024a]